MQSKGLSRVFSITTVQKHQFFGTQLSLWPRKIIVLTRWAFVGKVMSLLFNMLSRFVVAFLPRSKHLLIPWLQSPSTLILEPKKIKSLTVSSFPIYLPEVMEPDAIIFQRRTWQPSPVFLPRESHGQRSLVGCCPWGRPELDTTEAT